MVRKVNLVFLDLRVRQGDMEPKETLDLLDCLVRQDIKGLQVETVLLELKAAQGRGDRLVTLVLQALMAIQDLGATRVGMGSLDHLVKTENQSHMEGHPADAVSQGHQGPLENQVALGDLVKEFLDHQVIQESQVNAAPLVQWDLQEGRDLVLLGRKETRVILAVQDSEAILVHLAPKVPQGKE